MAFFATGELYGWDETKLLAALASAQTELASGSALIAVNSGDVSQQRMIAQSSSERIARFQRGLYELYLQDPDIYAKYSLFDCAAQSTTLGKVSI